MSTWWLKGFKHRENTPSSPVVRLLLPQIPAELVTEPTNTSTESLLSLEELRCLSVSSSSETSRTAELIAMAAFSPQNKSSQQQLRFSCNEHIMNASSRSSGSNPKANLPPILKKSATGGSLQLGLISDGGFNTHNRHASNETSHSLHTIPTTTLASQKFQKSTEQSQLSSDELNVHSSLTGDHAVATASVYPRSRSTGSLGLLYKGAVRSFSSISLIDTQEQSVTDVQAWSVAEQFHPSQNTKHLVTHSQSNDISGTNGMASVNSSQDDLQSLQSLEMAFSIDIQESLEEEV